MSKFKSQKSWLEKQMNLNLWTTPLNFRFIPADVVVSLLMLKHERMLNLWQLADALHSAEREFHLLNFTYSWKLKTQFLSFCFACSKIFHSYKIFKIKEKRNIFSYSVDLDKHKKSSTTSRIWEFCPQVDAAVVVTIIICI